ncbi:hypothetical protein E4T44_00780 [Aureobasidium sp. EXF-8845]|nr:hypothetical protein E4T44_00780 [Aureobasidium sp. EXF-8845]KAI4857776.1 hypothetical protein E4T45_00722 [Aureobasidium sp. EXF-8846]
MSSLKYINEPGAGEKHSDMGHYSQIVVIGNMAKLSGQGGWDETGELSKYDWQQQIDNAFDNVERVLKAAGLRGWEDYIVNGGAQVYLLRSYQTDIDAHWGYLIERLKQRVPGHRPLWTALGVSRLALPEMSVELEVEAIKHET